MPTDMPSSPGPSLRSIDDDEDRVFEERIRLDSSREPDDKLSRELYVMAGGTLDAVKNLASKNTLASTALELAGSAAAGFAIRAAESEIPALRPAIAIGGVALTYSLGRDFVGNGKELGTIIKDTWNNKDHNEQNRAAFAEHGGKFAVDLALTTGAGLAGSALANRTLFCEGSGYSRIATFDDIGLFDKQEIPHNRLFKDDDPVAKIFHDNEAATLRLSGYKNGNLTTANAFIISDDGLVLTNHHAVAGKNNLKLKDIFGKSHSATVLASDKAQDLAVLQLQKSTPDTVFKPAKLAQEDLKPGDPFYLLSRHRGNLQPDLAPGTVRDYHTLEVTGTTAPPGTKVKKVDITLTPFSRQIKLSSADVQKEGLVDALRGTGNYFSRPGVSGSALFNADGEVAGVHVGNIGSWFSKLTARNCFAPISSSTKLIEAALANRTKMF